MSPDEQTTRIFHLWVLTADRPRGAWGCIPVTINNRPAKEGCWLTSCSRLVCCGILWFQSFLPANFSFFYPWLCGRFFSSVLICTLPIFPLKAPCTAGPSCIQLLLPLYISLPPHIDLVPEWLAVIRINASISFVSHLFLL